MEKYKDLRRVKVVSDIHLTSIEKKLLLASLNNDLVVVSTKKKQLIGKIVEENEIEMVIDYELMSYEVGIGLGSKQRWIKSKFKVIVKK